MANAKGNDVASNTQIPKSLEGASFSKAATSPKEVEEFPRIIKKNDYRMVNQLKHTPSKISMVSFLLSSEAHWESLMKVLGAAHTTKDIMADQFDGVVANIATGSYLGFSDIELPS